MKVKDPVCGMTIEDSEAAATSTYKGETYYFCSKPCKEDFDKDPEAFVSEKAFVIVPLESCHLDIGRKSAKIIIVV